eukprot:8165368-Alexandrium_andersonii.AAC.1
MSETKRGPQPCAAMAAEMSALAPRSAWTPTPPAWCRGCGGWCAAAGPGDAGAGLGSAWPLAG